MRKILALLLVLSIALLGACSDDDDEGSASDTTAADAEPGGDAGDAGACDEYEAGTDGVIRTFCDGDAVVKVTVKGTDHEIAGGTCEPSGGFFTINSGVVVGAEWPSGQPLPDYAGMNLPAQAGEFSGDNLVITITVDGVSYGLKDVTGNRDGAAGSFTGTDRFNDGGEITGTFDCG